MDRSSSLVWMTHSHCVRKKNSRKGRGFKSHPVHPSTVPFSRSASNKEQEMKITREEFQRIGEESQLELFHQGIKAKEIEIFWIQNIQIL